MPKARRFAIDTPPIPIFNYQDTPHNQLTISRVASAMETAYLMIGINKRKQIQINRKDKPPQNITFRARCWGYNMTAPIVCKGLGRIRTG